VATYPIVSGKDKRWYIALNTVGYRTNGGRESVSDNNKNKKVINYTRIYFCYSR